MIPATFWFLLEVLRDKDLYHRVKAELDTTRTANNSFDPPKLISNPLLQSIYAEVPRLHTASMLTRTVKKAHNLDSWTLKQN